MKNILAITHFQNIMPPQKQPIKEKVLFLNGKLKNKNRRLNYE